MCVCLLQATHTLTDIVFVKNPTICSLYNHMHSSVAESFLLLVAVFSGKTGVFVFLRVMFQNVLLLFVRYDILKGVMYFLVHILHGCILMSPLKSHMKWN